MFVVFMISLGILFGFLSLTFILIFLFSINGCSIDNHLGLLIS